MLLLVFALSSCIDSPLAPEIKTGEFDFTVMYEFNGEIKTVSGVSVISGEGIGFETDPDIIADQYGARIISYEYADPIVNTYE